MRHTIYVTVSYVFLHAKRDFVPSAQSDQFSGKVNCNTYHLHNSFTIASRCSRADALNHVCRKPRRHVFLDAAHDHVLLYEI